MDTTVARQQVAGKMPGLMKQLCAGYLYQIDSASAELVQI